MKEKVLTNLILIGVVVLFFLGIFGYTALDSWLNEPMAMEKAQEKLTEDKEEIQLILDFLMGLNSQRVTIDRADGTMEVSFTYEKIENAQVRAAVKTLFDEKDYYSICKQGKTVYFMQWCGVRDISCGVAYTEYGMDKLQVDFLVEKTALSQENWYYCVCDYEYWSASQQQN